MRRYGRLLSAILTRSFLAYVLCELHCLLLAWSPTGVGPPEWGLDLVDGWMSFSGECLTETNRPLSMSSRPGHPLQCDRLFIAPQLKVKDRAWWSVCAGTRACWREASRITGISMTGLGSFVTLGGPDDLHPVKAAPLIIQPDCMIPLPKGD